MTDLCVEMSESLISILEDTANKDHVFFSHKSSFYVSGMVNKRSCRIWLDCKLELDDSEKKRNRTGKILNFPTGTVN